ncbi:MAG: hypothetical protein IJO10_11085 [Clostridia bacterium]|nr:hypothetical protein [Clostridia bacterium]
MTDVLGWELTHAVAALEAEGFSVVTVGVSSRKGVKGNESRVIRQRQTGEAQAELTFSVFKTDLMYQES